MKKSSTIDLNKILNNKTLGSSELESLINNYFFSIRNDRSKIKDSIGLVRNKLGHFTTINSYLVELKNQLRIESKASLEKFLTGYQIKKRNEAEVIFSKMKSHLAKLKSIITISRSGTVLELLKLLQKHKKNIKVVICESRPKLEGRLSAIELAKIGIQAELITDAMMGIYVPKVDAAIIGTDSILRSGNVVNKAGSYALALLCKEHKKPFYVVAASSKFSNKNAFRLLKEDPKEIWDKKLKNLNVSNFYFEEIPKKFITKIFSD